MTPHLLNSSFLLLSSESTLLKHSINQLNQLILAENTDWPKRKGYFECPEFMQKSNQVEEACVDIILLFNQIQRWCPTSFPSQWIPLEWPSILPKIQCMYGLQILFFLLHRTEKRHENCLIFNFVLFDCSYGILMLRL